MAGIFRRRWPVFVFLGLCLAVLASTGTAYTPPRIPDELVAHLSQSVVVRHWIAHPEQAPGHLRERFQQVNKALGQAREQVVAEGTPQLFNLDGFGLPQNEESVTVCRSSPNVVVGGTNDYRGIIDPQFNLTGWHLSTDGGNTVAREGLLPPVDVAGTLRPSGGDPVYVADAGCDIYAGSLNYDPFDPFLQSNGIGVYKSDPATLASCPGGSDPSCWPVRRAIAVAEPSHFLDKEWVHVGVSGDAGLVVWTVFADFAIDPQAPLGFTGASIKAVRCDSNLVSCTEPILISGDDPDVEFADVTVGPDGRTYITWSEIQGELEETAQTFVHKLRVAEPGSTDFGRTMIVAREDRAIPFGGFLHANDFRVATYPKHEVASVGGRRPRIFVVWDACVERPLDFICEEPQILLRYSDNGGRGWSRPVTLSQGGDNYFPTIALDPTTSRLVVAWYTNRFDSQFHNRQDVEVVTLDPATLAVTNRQRITPVSNETEADPLLGGFFIGDYFEVFAHDGTAYVHFNANFRQVRLLGLGIPVPQQDNFLVKVPE